MYLKGAHACGAFYKRDKPVAPRTKTTYQLKSTRYPVGLKPHSIACGAGLCVYRVPVITEVVGVSKMVSVCGGSSE